MPEWVTVKEKPNFEFGKLTFAGLFSGCGGLDLGGMLAGFQPVYAADFDAIAIETYRNNLGNHAECIDLSKSNINPNVSGIDLLLGGPPCQGFSSAGPKNSTDPRNKLWLNYLEYVEKWNPKVFILENVPGFLREFSVFSALVDSRFSGKYRVFFRRFVTQYYGVPQFRDRIIVQGIRMDVADRPAWPNPTSEEVYHYTRKFSTAISMASALQDLGPADSSSSIYKDHLSVPLGKSEFPIALHIPNGGSLKDIPDDYLPEPYFGRVRTHGGWTWYFRKPRSALPARGVIASIRPNYATILVPDVYLRGDVNNGWTWENIDSKTHTTKDGYYTSPVPPRRLTMRECARLQTFPDWFKFSGNPIQVHRQIGNAVPVEFSRRLCESIKMLIEFGN